MDITKPGWLLVSQKYAGEQKTPREIGETKPVQAKIGTYLSPSTLAYDLHTEWI
jgi:hypothetical protein